MSLESQYDTGYSGAQIKALLASVNYPTLVEKLIRYDDDHLLVWDSEDADKAKKIKVSNLIPAGANANLLHNWDFRNPVNQRGQSIYTDVYLGKYTIDRWCGLTTWGSAPANVTVLPGEGIEIKSVPIPGYPQAYGVLLQKIENAAAYSGLTLTFSAEVASAQATDGGMYPRIRLGENYVDITGPGIFSVTKTFGTITELLAEILVFTGATTSNSVVIKRCKLEPGSISTLANDPPADYGEELRKCQRYFYRTGVSGFANAVIFEGNGTVYGMANVRFPVTMRIAPTVTFYSIAGTQDKITNWATGLDFADISVQTATGAGKDGFGVIETSTALIAGNAYTFHYEANAEL